MTRLDIILLRRERDQWRKRQARYARLGLDTLAALCGEYASEADAIARQLRANHGGRHAHR